MPHRLAQQLMTLSGLEWLFPHCALSLRQLSFLFDDSVYDDDANSDANVGHHDEDKDCTANVNELVISESLHTELSQRL